MNVMHDIAEARASALSLRASAQACGADQGPLKFRLLRAAEALNTMVLLAVRSLERLEQLNRELRQLQTKPEKVHAPTPAEEADIGDALREVHKRLANALARIAAGMRAVDRYDHAIINIVLVRLDHDVGVELSDARTRFDSEKEMAALSMARQIGRLRARLGTMAVST